MPFTSVELAARVERAESRMIEKSARAAGRRRPESQVFVDSVAGGVAAATVPGSPFNKLAGLGFAGALDPTELTRVEQEFIARGIAVQAEVSSLGDPSIVTTFSERGYRPVGFENVLGLHLPAGLRHLRPANEVAVSRSAGDEWPHWLDVVVSGFAAPDSQGVPSSESFPRQELEQAMTDMAAIDGFATYLARIDGTTVGGASMRCDPDGVAQLCGAATLPAYRRRGVHTSLLAFRLAAAAQRGCDVAVVTTQPGSTSCRNVQKWGFELLYVRAVLVLEPAAD
ncbi:MAG: GNAT family N-acetyltransferase [Thermoanaerobaculia bacterium]